MEGSVGEGVFSVVLNRDEEAVWSESKFKEDKEDLVGEEEEEEGEGGEEGVGVGGDVGEGYPFSVDGADTFAQEPIENLVFRGGGVKGIAYCGALRILSDLNLLGNVKRFGGSSAGAITATLLAVGYNMDELELIFKEMELSKFKDGKGGIVSKAERLFSNFSLYEGKYFYEWIGKLITGKDHDLNITFQQLFDKNGKELVITGTCLSHMEVHYFSYRTSPDMSIRDAVRISMSIPILFEPIKIDDHVFVDGGLADNFPLCIFDSETLDPIEARNAGINMKTLGMFLQEDKTRQSVTRQITNVKEFVGCLLDTVKARIALLSMKPGDEHRTLFIQTHFVSSTTFSIGKEEKELLYYEGQRSARIFFGNLITDDAPAIHSRLVVQLKQGKHLKKRHIACNIYCLLSVGQVSRKSTPKFRSTNPIWNENFVFTAMDGDVLKLEVFDSDTRTPKTLMGEVVIQLTDLIDKGPTDMELKIGDEKERGTIFLTATLSTPK